ncbi:hypothetical protein NKR23_g9349 [Pleurostoma richardsiae]|uniref:DNA-directed RNA polymerase II subunit RPB9-like zinc ribbon domain-containing protein n=1 Tax=Pleurostoma richardsiae TaxID=41990 RepID=A0AA38RCM9_9PEZI|nr:hypothetical protein NKR23_g9349 [Pleurostoma richardsiae]
MATPTSTTSHEGRDSKKNFEQITFRFCSECSNMLYPKEDEDSRKLQFTCRTCQYTEEATSSCVFRNVLNNAAGETAGVTQDVGSDPTVGVPSSYPSHDGTMSLLLCLLCGKDIICSKCDVHPALLRYSNIADDSSLFRCHEPTSGSQTESLDELLAALEGVSYGDGMDLDFDEECEWDLAMDENDCEEDNETSTEGSTIGAAPPTTSIST